LTIESRVVWAKADTTRVASRTLWARATMTATPSFPVSSPIVRRGGELRILRRKILVPQRVVQDTNLYYFI